MSDTLTPRRTCGRSRCFALPTLYCAGKLLSDLQILHAHDDWKPRRHTITTSCNCFTPSKYVVSMVAFCCHVNVSVLLLACCPRLKGFLAATQSCNLVKQNPGLSVF